MQSIYFNIRPNSRERMWDTIKQSQDVCNVLIPNIQQSSSIKIHSKSQSVKSKLKYQASKFFLNTQKVDNAIAKNADILYMWGAFPQNSNKSFIVELDNPYALVYYHTESIKRHKEKIKKQLDKAKKITYLSNTAKNHTLELYGSEFAEKSIVSYPFMQENYYKNNRDAKVINFIFVGLNARLKGGLEVLEAFTHIDNENIKLTFISNISDDIKQKYQKDTRINILPPQPREKLLNEIYPKMDVMIFPSLYESFGVVLLEALSFGMGIIAVNTYATPEIVQNNTNGKLLHHPILQPILLNNQQVVNCVDYRIKEFYANYLTNNEFYYGLYEKLKESIQEGIERHQTWQKESINLFNKTFAPKVWQENFVNILE
jgi:glycosyltransferase involved in cell wall biosynthesis